MAVDTPKKGRGYKPKEGKDRELESASTDSKADPIENWAEQQDSPAYEAALKLYKLVNKAYQNKDEQYDDRIEEYWNAYNAIPDANQQYIGNSSGYIPAIRDAINARAKRALKQLFPANMKHVEAVASDGRTPYTQLSLLEHYIRKTKLRSIVRTDLIAGDVTGQWNLMVDWTSSTFNIKKLVKRNPLLQQIDGESVEDLEIEDPTADEEEDIDEETVEEQGPEIVDFATEDLAVVPPTCTDLQKAKAVSIKLRMSAEKVRELVDEGVFILPPNTDIEEFCKPDQSRDRKNPQKKATGDAGIKTEGTNKHAVIYQVYSKLDLGSETKDDAIIYYAGETEIVGIIRNPLWSGKRPILSKPVERKQGSFFGSSKIEPVKFLGWQLNDFWNQGMDSAMYSLQPIWAVDPLKCPQWMNLTMGLAAMWPIDPNSVKQITQTQLWKDAAGICDLIKRQIWESMDVNEMMMGRMPAGRKNNQLMGAMSQEQQVNITDHASRYEEEMLNPLLELLFEFDQQYRTSDLMIETRGEIGAKAALEVIPPQQWGERYFFRWTGTEFMLSIQRGQQQIALMNVLKGIPPAQLNGRTFDATPILESLVENLFGPEMAPRILVDKRNSYRIDPDIENEMLANGFEVQVHEADDDPMHLQAHMRGASLATDPLGLFKSHMGMHMAQMQRKREMEMMQQAPKGVPGGPGGAGPGVPGGPKPGAMPAPGGPRPAQQPAGSIQTDNMLGAPGRG